MKVHTVSLLLFFVYIAVVLVSILVKDVSMFSNSVGASGRVIISATAIFTLGTLHDSHRCAEVSFTPCHTLLFMGSVAS